jgi:hypothetical protein
METAVATVIAIIFGGFLNMTVAIWAEHRRRAPLTLSIEAPIDMNLHAFGAATPQQPFRSLRVRVSNSPRGSLDRWMRSPALQCRGRIMFHRSSDGSEIFGRPMEGRWAGALQPSPIPAVDATQQNIAFFIHDPERLSAGSRVDIYPGESELLDITVRFQDDPNCYGWNNETYFKQPVGKNPDWQLASDHFLVKVVINSTGQKCEGVFRLINDVPYNAFRLKSADQAEIARVLQQHS